MKTLIFTLIFSLQAFAAPVQPEITDPQIARQLVGVAQDIKNEQVIANAPDLKSCQDDYQKQSGSISNDPQALANLETCIKTKIGNKTGQQLSDFSDKLNLETYKLIPSKSLQNITKYLTQKLYQSLTNVDIEEKDIARKIQAMKFNNKKQVDHRDFYDLYKNQIAKNALTEVSRFCLVDFRNESPPPGAGNTFIEHWDELKAFTSQNPPIAVTDDGATDPFGSTSTKAQDTEASYRDIMKNIFKGDGAQAVVPDEKKLSNFFFFCGKKINELCDDYEKSCATSGSNRNCTGAPSPGSTGTASTTVTTPIKGAKACIAKTRLMAYKKAMKASEDIVKGLTDKAGSDFFLALDKNEMVKRYQRGVGSEKSLNELTNNASIDFYKATENESTKEAEDCANDPAKCDQFVVVSDAETRIEQNTNLMYLAKREAEMKRVKELQGQALDEFLEKNYPDIKEQMAKNPQLKVEELIGQRWDARRQAVIDDIKTRVSDRQVTDNEVKNDKNKREDVAQSNAREALSEKTRLAQVIFFNNIISSSLNLQTQSGQGLGRNLQALTNELDSADSEVNGAFSNLRQLTNSSGGSSGGSSQLTGNESVTNIDFLDDFIGVPKKQNGNNRGTAGRPE